MCALEQNEFDISKCIDKKRKLFFVTRLHLTGYVKVGIYKYGKSIQERTSQRGGILQLFITGHSGGKASSHSFVSVRSQRFIHQ